MTDRSTTRSSLKSSPPPKSDRSSTSSGPPSSGRSLTGFSEITSFLWSVADLLRGDYRQADYGKVILPSAVLRRLDCVLDKTKAKVLAKHEELKKAKHPEGTVERMLRQAPIAAAVTGKLDLSAEAA